MRIPVLYKILTLILILASWLDECIDGWMDGWMDGQELNDIDLLLNFWLHFGQTWQE